MQLLDEHITENIVKVWDGLAVCSTSDRTPTLDRGRILSASCWDPTRISPVVVAVLLLLRRSGTSQI